MKEIFVEEIFGSKERTESSVRLIGEICSQSNLLGQEYAKVGDLVQKVQDDDIYTTRQLLNTLTRILEITGDMFSNFSAFQSIVQAYYDEQLKAKQSEEKE